MGKNKVIESSRVGLLVFSGFLSLLALSKGVKLQSPALLLAAQEHSAAQ